MKQAKRRLGALETQFITWTQARKLPMVRTGDLVNNLGFSKQQEASLLLNMSKMGLIVKLKRGLYLVPSRLPPGGRYSPSPYRVLSYLMASQGGRYQITGLTLFNIHGLDSQVPNAIFAYNTVFSGRQNIGGYTFELIKVSEKHLGDTMRLKISDDFEGVIVTKIGSLARALFDAIYDHDRFGTLPKAYQWILERQDDRVLLRQLVEVGCKYGNIGTQRRIGYFLEHLRVATTMKLFKAIPKRSSLIPLVPNKSGKGSINKKWGIIVNDEIGKHD